MASGKGYDNKEDHTEDSKPQTKPEDVEMASSSDEGSEHPIKSNLTEYKYGKQEEEYSESKERPKTSSGATSDTWSDCKVNVEGKGLHCIPYSKRERMAQELDKEFSANGSWKDLARELNIDPATIARVDYTRDTRKPTEALFIYLKFSRPKLDLKDFMAAAGKVGRTDIVHYIETVITVEDDVNHDTALSKIGERRLSHITHLVSDCGGRPGYGWRGIAEQLKINTKTIDRFEHERTRVRRDYSPTLELLHILKARDPKNALQSLRDGLKAIKRNDIILILDE